MHVNLSFSYLRFAEAASFDKKELLRSCTAVFQFVYSGRFLYFVIGQWAGLLSAHTEEF